MAYQVCYQKLSELSALVQSHGTFVLVFCILNIVFSLVAIAANLLVIGALWKTSSIPATIKKLFLSLAFSDLAVGMVVQLMFVVIIAVMLRMASTGNKNFASFCPKILGVFYFLFSLLCCASLLNIIVIAVDRLLAISLHLRYHELVTAKRINLTLASLWLTSGGVGVMFILFRTINNSVGAAFQAIGLLLMTAAYIRIYKVVKHHQNQIQSQLHSQNAQAMDLLRQRRSALNALFVYLVFLACYVPLFLSLLLLLTVTVKIPLLLFDHASVFLIFLNSSLNPILYCWRYHEIRRAVKSVLKTVFC